MPLSRLENFLKNAEGNILYVNPSDFDATDSYENRGNSLTRPFRTIQRALIESARFSYRQGRNNDKIDSTTILVYPGTHYIDNRPGHSVEDSGGSALFKKYVNGQWQTPGAGLSEFNENTNFDIFDEENELYKYNSVNGGVVLPRGTSIVGLDLRKTKIRPLYVPDPNNPDVKPTSIFRMTGTCYFTAFSFFDADPSRQAYTDSTAKKVNPKFSHHKLSCFEYADGVNDVILDGVQTGITDLEMYYYKVTFAYGDSGGRALADYPSTGALDFEPSIDEFRIVGDLKADPLGITSIRSGDGVIPTQVITVDTNKPHGLFKDTPVLVAGISTNVDVYNGSFVVADVLSDTRFTYESTSVPTDLLPNQGAYGNASIVVESDSTSSASPYVFSCSLRSVFGVNGLHADGSKATGFKSALTAQFTGISLQKDDNAFVLFDEATGIYNDNDTVDDDQKPLHTNSRAIYKPEWENFHMRCSNDSIIQCVSIFAIGFAKHFVAESGGDQSITNSNSNFGAISLESAGFQANSFDRDDVGYITHIIPPREPEARIANITWLPLDAQKIVSTGATSKLWLANFKSADVPPPSEIDSYKIGGKRQDQLVLQTITGTAVSSFYSPIQMTVPSGISTEAFKTYTVGRASGINSISSNIITFTDSHQLFNGEKIRIYSNTGEMPANLEANRIYYAQTTGLNANQIKISSSVNDAEGGTNITGISNGGGELQVLSTVADKVTGEPGHPIQFDDFENQWYVNSSGSTFVNEIYTAVTGIGTIVLGEVTGATFITRQIDNRGIDERIYKMRYVVPKEYKNARPPSDGFILQESKNVGVGSVTFFETQVSDPTELRNPRIITKATYSSVTQRATIKSEKNHNLVVGDEVVITNVLSTNNQAGTATSAYNGTYEVHSIPNERTFEVSVLTGDPGEFLNLVNQRNTQQQVEALPTFRRSRLKDTLFIYRSREIKPHVPGADGQDGIYAITAICGSVSPNENIGYGISYKKFNQDIRTLYPQQDRDNYNSDPRSAISHAQKSPLGRVLTNDRRNSITKESKEIFLENNNLIFQVNNCALTGTGNTTATLTLDRDHGLNQIKELSVLTPGAGYNNSAGITTTIYAADLTTQSGFGEGGVIRANVSVGNTIESVKIVEGGSAYAIGNTMTVSSEPAGAPTESAVVVVQDIYNVIGHSLELSGFAESRLDGVYKIVDVPDAKTVVVRHDNLAGVPIQYKQRDDARKPVVHYAGSGLLVENLAYNEVGGIATVTTRQAHAFLPGNTFKVFDSGDAFFDGKFQVLENIGIHTFSFTAGVSTVARSFATDTTIQRFGLSSQGKPVGAGEENLGGRSTPIYTGISTALSANCAKTDVLIQVSDSNGFGLGDYVQLGEEILRITTNPSGNTLSVIRGQFSTPAQDGVAGQMINKINILPMELRRHSILRASGHTFEYLGFGPGNYSTGMPQVQDRVLTDDEVYLAQAREQDGGTVVYTGMNDRGEFFTGATKVNGATGEEEVFEAPIVSYFGDEAKSEVSNANNGIFDDLVVKNAITVEGGVNQNRTSQFYGPVAFGAKVTVSSEEGLETSVLKIKGESAQPKEITVGIQTPTVGKRVGDISLKAQPEAGEYLGHIFTGGDWRRFGVISKEKNLNSYRMDKLGIGQTGQGSIFDGTDAVEVNGTVKIQNLYVGGAVTFAANQTFAGVSYETIEVRDEITFPITYAGDDNYVIKTENANAIAQFANLEITGAAVTFGNETGVYFEERIHSKHAGVSTFNGTVQVGELRSDNLVTGQTGIFTSVECQYLQVGTYASIKAGYATDFYVENDLSTDILYGATGIITTLSGDEATYDTVNATDVFTNGLRASKLDAPSASINAGIVTTLIVPKQGAPVFDGDSAAASGWAGLHQAYIGVGIVTTLIIPDTTFPNGAGQLNNSPVDGWLGAPTAYVNTGIITNLTSTTANVDKVNATVVNALKVRGNDDDDNPTGDGYLWMLNGQFSSKLWLSGTADDEGLRSNVGVITYFGPSAKSVLGAADLGSMQIYAGPTGKIRGQQLQSTVATGTPPLTVNSTTKVTNLNADTLDGHDSGDFIEDAVNVWHNDRSGNKRLYFGTGSNSFQFQSPSSKYVFNNSSGSSMLSMDGTEVTVSGNLNINSLSGGDNFAELNKVRLGAYCESFKDLGSVSGNNIALDCSQSSVFKVTLSGNSTFKFTNVPNDPQGNSAFAITLIAKNGTNSPSIGFQNTQYSGGAQPTKTPTNGKSDVWTFLTYDGGSNWLGNLAIYNYSV